MPNLLNSFGRTKALVDNSGYTILNLSGAQKFDDNTVFNGGTYLIDVVAGSTFVGTALNTPGSGSSGKGVGGRVYVEVIIPEPFVIRAYCGSKGNYGIGGTNPYSGAFKENATYQTSTPVMVNHIFGNVGGSAAIDSQGIYFPGSGNCLGDGVGINTNNNLKYGIGAGSCLHLLPIGGSFGSDYLFAAHCAPSATGWYGSPRCIGGCGSAYGGAAGGVAAITSGYSVSAYNGGSSIYGDGGIGVTASSTDWPPLVPTAANGIGIGSGKINATNIMQINWPQRGAAAYFNGEEWLTSNLYGNTEEDGHIIVTLVRPLY